MDGHYIFITNGNDGALGLTDRLHQGAAPHRVANGNAVGVDPFNAWAALNRVQLIMKRIINRGVGFGLDRHNARHPVGDARGDQMLKATADPQQQAAIPCRRDYPVGDLAP